MRSTHSSPYIVLRPTLADFVLKMPRGAQVIYPKDLGPLLMLADIYPGARVLRIGCRQRRAVDDDAARRRARSPRTNCAPTSPIAPRATCTISSGETRSTGTRSNNATPTKGIDVRRRRSGRARSPRTVAGRAARGASDARWRHPGRLHAEHHASRAATRCLGRQRIHVQRNDRGAQPQLAHRGRVSASGSPHGRPHRFLDDGSPRGRARTNR